MSQWHHAHGRRGQRRGFSGRSSARRKGGKHIPERVLKRILLQKNVFPPWIFLNKIQEQNKELGLIIDLTYTRRYYKPEDLLETIPYLKICTIGYPVPDDDTIFKFQCAVNGFLKKNKDNDRLIGVHCTHGLNRTGYLICREEEETSTADTRDEEKTPEDV